MEVDDMYSETEQNGMELEDQTVSNGKEKLFELFLICYLYILLCVTCVISVVEICG